MKNGENDNQVMNNENDWSFDNDYIPADAKPLCPECLQPCNKGSYYCPNCGSHQAINPLTAYMPFQNIRYNYGGIGVMWRRLCNIKETPVWLWLLYLLVFVVFAPFVLISFCVFSLIFKNNDK